MTDRTQTAADFPDVDPGMHFLNTPSDGLPNALMREIGANWLRKYAKLSDDDDPAFIAACVYRVMRWALHEPSAPELRHLRSVTDEQ